MMRYLVSRRRSAISIMLMAVAAVVVGGVVPWSRARARAPSEWKVIMEVAVVRHGIRAPTHTPQSLLKYSNGAWPTWPVAPGELTHHGMRLMQSVGQWYRHSLGNSGLGFGGCAAVRSQVKVISDSDNRNRQSAAALVQGFAPQCSMKYYAFAVGHDDPLFRGMSKVVHVESTVEALSAPTESALHTLEFTLLGCRGSACVSRARDAGKLLVLGVAPGEAIHRAGSLAEDIMLEYAQGMPLDRVGWGRVGADGVAWLITLHNASERLRKWPHQVAVARDGNILSHIVATLQHAAGHSSALPSLASSQIKALLLIGHDTDLATEAGLLGADWHEVGQPDDYPPGGMLIYQLVKDGRHYGVGVHVALPTLTGLRTADVGTTGGMHQGVVRLPGCGGVAVCPLKNFVQLVHKVVPDSMVIRDSGNEPLAN